MTYQLICGGGHRLSLDATELQTLLEEGDFECPTCSASLEAAGQIRLQCHICDMTWDVQDLEEGAAAVDAKCDHCAEFTPEPYYRVPGSHAERIAMYEWSRNGANPKALARAGRADYWEGLIHFCERAEFIEIVKSGRIRASPTGYFRAPAVCLTETPASDCSEVKKVHGDYGFVFRKSDLLKIGGNPALYLTRLLINAQAFDPRLRPFINLLRTPKTDPNTRRHDFLHEREWRVPHDIILEDVPPFGVVLPELKGTARFGGKDGAVVLSAAEAYEELG